jgi:hypothetical protein
VLRQPTNRLLNSVTLGEFAVLRFLPLSDHRHADRALKRNDRHHDEQRSQAELEPAAR